MGEQTEGDESLVPIDTKATSFIQIQVDNTMISLPKLIEANEHWGLKYDTHLFSLITANTYGPQKTAAASLKPHLNRWHLLSEQFQNVSLSMTPLVGHEQTAVDKIPLASLGLTHDPYCRS